jgi:hypothetical protein
VKFPFFWRSAKSAVKKRNRFEHIAEEKKYFDEAFKNSPKIEIPPGSPESTELRQKTQERIAKMPGEMAELSTGLAARSWFVGADMPFRFLYALRRHVLAGEIEEVDGLMEAYIELKLDTIEEAVLKEFSSRAEILAAAFEAHRRKEFVLAVPVFLAQADGVCSELLGVGLYNRTKGKPKTANHVAILTPSIMSYLLEPLKVAGALNAVEDERHKYPDILNRHQVLHGKSLDYGNKTNSYRAISLLSYLESVLVTAKDLHEFKSKHDQSLG